MQEWHLRSSSASVKLCSVFVFTAPSPQPTMKPQGSAISPSKQPSNCLKPTSFPRKARCKKPITFDNLLAQPLNQYILESKASRFCINKLRQGQLHASGQMHPYLAGTKRCFFMLGMDELHKLGFGEEEEGISDILVPSGYVPTISECQGGENIVWQ